LKTQAFKDMGALQILTNLAGTPDPKATSNPAATVDWAKGEMQRIGLDDVRVLPGKSPEWVRGTSDSCLGVGVGIDIKLTCASMPGSPGTPKTGIIGEVVRVTSLQEAKGLGEKAKGAMILFDAPVNPDYISGHRFIGAGVAASLGAAGVMVRSTGSGSNDVSQPSEADFDPKSKTIPIAVVSSAAITKLMGMVKDYPGYHVQLTFDCKMAPEVPSSEVVGQITGSDLSKEVVLLGGHIDSVYQLPPTRNDGVGAVESIEALRLIKTLGWKPKRTIRVVVLVDESRGGTAAQAFADFEKSAPEKIVAAVGTDELGFEPKGYAFSVKDVASLTAWRPYLAGLDVEHLTAGGDPGADVTLLKPSGTVVVALEPKAPRYFDYRRADKFVLSKVNSHDLEAGAASLAMLSWLISEEGIR